MPPKQFKDIATDEPITQHLPISICQNVKSIIDFVSKLPDEISDIIFLARLPKTLLISRRVSKSWKK